MLNTLFLITALLQASATKIVDKDHTTRAINPALIDEINAMKTTWQAGVPSKFANATVADVKRLLGTVMPGEDGYYAPEVEKISFKYSESDLPTSFDVRTAWPNCAAITGHIRDQSNCGSCWAFGSTETFNDRYCIATGDNKTLFSTEDTLSCCSGASCHGSKGCSGGLPSGAWKHFTRAGVSTGGDWESNNTGDTCKPYSLQSCGHHVEPKEGSVPCSSLPDYTTPVCTSECTDNKYRKPYQLDKFKASSSYAVRGAANMQKALMEHGSLTVSFLVFEDFETYTSGIYQRKSDVYLGGHAVKLVGWGEENGVKFWTVANSWNDNWGENGFFRIIRGRDECGIETAVVTGEI